MAVVDSGCYNNSLKTGCRRRQLVVGGSRWPRFDCAWSRTIYVQCEIKMFSFHPFISFNKRLLFPFRLAESVQGTDLEKIFKLDDPASTDVVVDNGNGTNNVQSSETNPTSVEYEQVKI